MISLLKVKGINPQTKESLYYPQWTRKETTDQNELAERMGRGSTFSVGEVNGVMLDFPAYILDELLAGNAVSIKGLGTFKLKVSGKSDKDKDKVTSAGCKASVVFEPAEGLAARLAEAQFKFVEVPTKEGEQDANASEAPANQDTTPTPTTEGDGGGEGGNLEIE